MFFRSRPGAEVRIDWIDGFYPDDKLKGLEQLVHVPSRHGVFSRDAIRPRAFTGSRFTATAARAMWQHNRSR